MEEVKNIVAEIEVKAKQLKLKLSAVRTENEVLTEKIQTLTNRLEEKEQEVRDFQDKINNLSQQTVVTDASSEAEHNEQIEALVREIDDCISRLKQ